MTEARRRPISGLARLVPPPGIDRLREQIYRGRYQREREAPEWIDLGGEG